MVISAGGVGKIENYSLIVEHRFVTSQRSSPGPCVVNSQRISPSPGVVTSC